MQPPGRSKDLGVQGGNVNGKQEKFPKEGPARSTPRGYTAPRDVVGLGVVSC